MLVLAVPTMLLAAERDPLQPRVPKDQMEAAKAMTNPFLMTPENVAIGSGLFRGKGTCFVCHGEKGQGDGDDRVRKQVGEEPCEGEGKEGEEEACAQLH